MQLHNCSIQHGHRQNERRKNEFLLPRDRSIRARRGREGKESHLYFCPCKKRKEFREHFWKYDRSFPLFFFFFFFFSFARDHTQPYPAGQLCPSFLASLDMSSVFNTVAAARLQFFFAVRENIKVFQFGGYTVVYTSSYM